MKLGFFISFLFAIVLVPTASGLDYNEYIDEFGNEGEVCSPADIFEYHQFDPKWWDSDYFSQTIPVFYQCCKNNECVVVIIDIMNKQLLYDDSVKELLDLNYIKNSLRSGVLSETYFVNSGTSLCNSYGGDELNKETLNLVAGSAEEIASAQKTKQGKQVITLVRTAKALEIVSPFSALDFGLSTVCSYNNQKIKRAVEALAECNLYLNNIEKNFARSGYVYQLNSCFVVARNSLKEYQGSHIAKAKFLADEATGVIDMLLRPVINIILNLFSGNTLPVELKAPEETEYEIALKVYKEIEPKQAYLGQPEKENIFNRYILRINEKNNEYLQEYSRIHGRVEALDSRVPAWINREVTDVFYEPNYNISTGISLLQEASITLDDCSKIYYEYRYNSAMNCLQSAESNYNGAESLISKEIVNKRIFDTNWIYFVLSILLLLILHGNKRGH